MLDSRENAVNMVGRSAVAGTFYEKSIFSATMQDLNIRAKKRTIMNAAEIR